VAVMARALGVKRTALHRWIRRQETERTGVRRGRPAVIGSQARERIRACYRSHFGEWGPRVLAAWCDREGLGHWNAGTIAAVIADLREPKDLVVLPLRYEMTASNVMWSEDGTGFRQRGRKTELLVVQDEHSRRKLHWRLANGPARADDVHAYLSEAFAKYGAPLVLKHDGDAIFHEPRIAELLRSYGVVELTVPPGYPEYNGKQERSMRDIKSYERALRRHEVGGSLRERLAATMKDLNEERPRPVLGGRTAREAYERGRVELPDRKRFAEEVEETERSLFEAATSRRGRNSAHRRAVTNVLIRHGLMTIEGDVSRNYQGEVWTE
jgi:hypothetical protein